MGALKNVGVGLFLVVGSLVIVSQQTAKKKIEEPTAVTTEADAKPVTALQKPLADPDTAAPQKPYRAPISPTAFQPISSAEKKLFKAWKKAGIRRIDAATKGAVELAALSEKCDQVFLSGLDYDRSTPPNDISVFALCANGERYNFTEEEVLAQTKPISVSESVLALSDTDAFNECEKVAKPTLSFPSTMDVSWFNSSVDRRETGANVALSFEAKNGLGAVLPYVAFCTIDDKKVHLLSIKPR